jgi:predicted lipid-binding transport protein (Tim44 family)
MQQIRIQLTGPGAGPGGNGGPGLVARILLSIGAVIMLVSAAFLGAIFFLAALGFFAVGMLVLAVRIWWARRQFEKAVRRGEAPGQARPGPGRREGVIEGEYRVVGEREQDAADKQHGGGER